MATPKVKIGKNELTTIRDCRLIFKNFEGKGDQYNRPGARNFHIVLEPAEAEQLMALGWNVKKRDPREEGGAPTYHMKVNVQYTTAGKPPLVMMVGSKNQTPLSESMLSILDAMDTALCDVTFRAYEYDPDSYSAYLTRGYFNIIEDDITDKYSHIPLASTESGAAPEPREPSNRGPRFE